MQQVRTFQAPSMPEALALVKRELGDQAVILGTRSCPPKGVGALLGKPGVEITAAAPGAAVVGPSHVGPAQGNAPRNGNGAPAMPEHVLAYYQKLVENEVAEQLAVRLARQAAARSPRRDPADANALTQVLRDAIGKMITVTGGVELTPGSVRRVALVGPAGGGKTTTLAKLAAQFKLRHKRKVAVLSLDMQRLGTNEQLRRYADIVGVELRTAQTVSGVKHALRELESFELVLIDTHGVCAGDQGHYARLAAVLRAARPHEIHLVLPASMTVGTQSRMAERFGPLGVSKVVYTHLDEAAGLGVILNAIERLSWGISYITDGETVPNHIEEACAERLATLILPTGAAHLPGAARAVGAYRNDGDVGTWPERSPKAKSS